MPKYPYAIIYRTSSFFHAGRGIILDRATVQPRPGVSWYGGRTVIRVEMDTGFQGWLRSGPMKRLPREGAYERLRADPVGILSAAARQGALDLARVIGRAAICSAYYYSNHSSVADGCEVSLEGNALRLYGALRGAHAAMLVREIPAWLRLLNSLPEHPRNREVIPPEEAWMIPYNQWEKSLFPMHWSVDMSRVALWGALQVLLFDGDGLPVDAQTRIDLVKLGEEMAQARYNMGSRFPGTDALLQYAQHEQLLFLTPWMGALSSLPAHDLGLPGDLPVLPYC